MSVCVCGCSLGGALTLEKSIQIEMTRRTTRLGHRPFARERGSHARAAVEKRERVRESDREGKRKENENVKKCKKKVIQKKRETKRKKISEARPTPLFRRRICVRPGVLVRVSFCVEGGLREGVQDGGDRGTRISSSLRVRRLFISFASASVCVHVLIFCGMYSKMTIFTIPICPFLRFLTFPLA